MRSKEEIFGNDNFDYGALSYDGCTLEIMIDIRDQLKRIADTTERYANLNETVWKYGIARNNNQP